MSLLAWLFSIPFITSLTAFLLRPLSGRPLKVLATLMSLIPLGMLLLNHTNWIGSNINYDWLPSLGIRLNLRIDSLSLVFLYLTAIIVPVSLLSVHSDRLTHPHTLYGLVLLLQALLIGFFTTRDLAFFTIFWEAMLIPLYFIINLWGGARRQEASMKFLIYMIAGSVFMVVAVISLYFAALEETGIGTFNMGLLSNVSSQISYATLLGAIFLLAFSVKTPLFPFHAWLPDAYTQAPLVGTILLSALLSKAGIYGFFRIGSELFPQQMKEWSDLLIGLAITGVLYGGLVAWRQKDYKKLIAYSSFSHVNFVLVGAFIWNEAAHSGAILQSLNHGITIAALFLAANWLEERIGTSLIGPYKGVARSLPFLCWITLIFVLSSISLPGTNNFIGEVLIFFGLFYLNPYLAALLGLSVILSVIYMLRWMQKIFFESPNFAQVQWPDIKGKELAIAIPLIALIIWIGIYPMPLLNQIKPATEKFLSISKKLELRT